MSKPRITLYSLGGTIAMSGDRRSGLTPALDGADLVAAVPELDDIAEVTVRSISNEPSSNLTISDIAALGGLIERDASGNADGVVITQGTDTLEECAFLLDLLIRVDVPVIVTGAMRSPALAGSDGPANLVAAVAAACHKPLGAAGVCVVMNEQIHAAAFVAKTHTADPGAFRSPSLGPIGTVHERRARILTRPVRPPHLPVPERRSWPQVGLLTTALDDAQLLRNWIGAGGFDGLVIEAFGAGHLSREVAGLLAEQARSLPVILASRTGAGPVFTGTYGYEGAEKDLIARGLIPAGHLSGPKSRLMLCLLLAGGKGRSDIHAAFDGLSG